MYYAKSDKEIIKWLDEHGLLLASEVINHSYPHCWRCKKPVIFRATSQWFASVDGFRKETLDAIKTVKWYPAWGEERIRGTGVVGASGDGGYPLYFSLAYV